MGTKELFDIGIIGAGPKGLAVATEAQSQGARVLTLDGHGPGRNWQPDRMNPNIALHPYGWEISPDSQKSFAHFFAHHVSERDKRRYPLEKYDGAPMAIHYRRYLQWLAQDLPISNVNVTRVNVQADGTQRIAYVDPHGAPDYMDCRSIVVASGMIGYGNTEFAYDPTGLVGKSKRVVHIPTTLETRKEIAEFIGDAKDVAVVGSGIAGSRPFWVLNELSGIRRIHLVSTSGVIFASDQQVWTQDQDGNYVSAIKPHDYERIIQESRVEFYPRKVIGGEERDGRVLLATDQGIMPPVDAVLVATGYRYDINQIPFLKSTLQSGIIDVSGRYPVLDSNYHATGGNYNMDIYFLGEAAIDSMGPQERWLASTAQAATTIVSSVNQLLKDRKQVL